MVRFCTYNARGLGDYQKRKKIFLLLKEKKLDIALIQESHGVDESMKLWRTQWGGELIYANATSNSKGILILFRRNLSYSIAHSICDPQGRYVITEIDFGEMSIVLCSLYAPNIDTPSFFVHLSQEIENLQNKQVIIGGDFNFAIDPTLDRKFSQHNNDKARDAFMAYADYAELSDVWRVFNRDVKQFSCCRPDSASGIGNKFSRLDMFFVSDALINRVVSCQMVPGFCSDHSFVIMEMDLASSTKGPGYWKFNASFLYDKKFLEAANAILDEAILKPNYSPENRWDMVKGSFIQFSKQYGIDKAKERKLNFDQVEESCYRLKIMVEELPYASSELQEQLEVALHKRDKLLQEKLNGIIVRSRIKYYEEGERSSKYFFSLEKHNSQLKTMHKIRNQKGQIISDPKKVVSEQANFYRKLYTSNKNVNFNLVNETERKLSLDQKIKMDKDLTIEELANAVKVMPNNKAPGLDGLIIEVYKVFWCKLGSLYCDALCALKDKGKLSLAFRRGLITLIPKKNRDLMELGNWRPLTMLTCEYKILAKTLALRLQNVLPELIHPDQTGYMKGRNIADNIRKTMEVICYTKKQNIPAIIVNLDFYKCFDVIEHQSVFRTLEYFGFGSGFIEWLKLLFVDFELCTQNNGWFSEFFPSLRSVHQGCPIAGFLQICCAQVLHDLLTNNTAIKGITVHELELLLAQFADDTTLFLTYDPICFQQVVATLDIVQRNIGFVINYDKTNVYRIGSLLNTNARFYTTHQLNWTNDPIELLGVTIPLSLESQLLLQLNYAPTVKKACQTLKQWSMRAFSLMGRVLIVNSLISSLFVYRMQVLPAMSDSLLKQLNVEISKYVWNNKRPKIAWDVLISDKSQGGLHLVDMHKRQYALKVQWIFCLENNPLWRNIVYSYISVPVHDFFFKCNFDYKHISCVFQKDIAQFWKDVILAWCKFNFVEITNFKMHTNSILWCNSCILIDNKPVVWPKAFRAGLMYVGQLFDEAFNFNTYAQFTQNFGNCISWLQYRQLCSAVQTRCTQEIPDTVDNYALYAYDRLSLLGKVTQVVYSLLIDNENALEKRKTRWNTKFSIELTNKEFLRVIKSIYSITISTKLRDFQYRLLTGILVTNRLLFLWKILPSQQCTLCKEANSIEDEIHLFCHCVKACKMWDALKNYIAQNNCSDQSLQLDWSPKNIIFSTVHPNPTNAINLLVTIVKKYIYSSRCLNTIPSPVLIEDQVEQIFLTETRIATRKNKLRLHAKKWSSLKRVDIPERDDFVLQYISDM